MIHSTRPYTFSDVVRSEWTKFRSVQSTYWTFLIALILGIGLSVLVSGVSASHYNSDPAIHFGWNPLQRSIRPGSLLAQLAFAVLGVITVTSEYSSGMIRTSLTAVPKRVRMMSAKLLVFGVAALLIGEVISVAAFSIGQAVIHGQAPSTSFGQHLVLRVVLGAGLYLVLVGLFGSAIAVLVRHAAAGIAIVVGTLFIAPGVVNLLPTSWVNPIEKYWPAGVFDTNAGTQIFETHHNPHALSAWMGLGEFALFVAVLIGIAFYFLERRDA
jgi:ABC-type transport system involved in multi-copper enzyme maturation permease subunit